ncbi:hypothetical protein NL676_007111 [Syzygium grande]|nr:hypothetical protein NL676_007111 [Syzygium grande]
MFAVWLIDSAGSVDFKQCYIAGKLAKQRRCLGQGSRSMAHRTGQLLVIDLALTVWAFVTTRTGVGQRHYHGLCVMVVSGGSELGSEGSRARVSSIGHRK